MHLDIITPDKVIFSGEITLVQLPGMDGLFEVLKNHAPMIAALKKGAAKVEVDGGNQFFEINGGIVEVLNDKVLVLAE
ncbi:ATP synthase F1 subunit epsilon [Bacteroidales bacterium OttesenSCG-928-B11]|nr:ATP synthase F1 subunit epsilon [Bacteroidales bacterium OttesenSCG-928-C03]MDL2311626.1 ATP synthase F1 subunit epsilon [Bacteroidales bacterium OttesenSCG-928-B11]MDL2326760.1 ATP synthase F1 subunit epsilon [Bacteroidales bacterium OttesenSCG-928-A14]